MTALQTFLHYNILNSLFRLAHGGWAQYHHLQNTSIKSEASILDQFRLAIVSSAH
jgi:hypothetical protein